MQPGLVATLRVALGIAEQSLRPMRPGFFCGKAAKKCAKMTSMIEKK
jgi:hypothetical protein